MVNMNWQPGMTLEAIEEVAIKQAFKFYRGNKSATSNALGITVRTLETKLETYGKSDKELGEQLERRRIEREAFLRRQRGLEPIAVVQPEDGRVRRTDAKEDGEASRTNGAGTESGLHVQPTEEASPERDMSLPVRKEVQSVPSKQASGHHSGKRR